jgi:type IV pilus assembly protein PilM
MIGIDISGRSIKAAEIVDRGGPVLRTFCWSSLGPNVIRRGVIQDVSLVAQAVKKTLTACSPVASVGNDVVGSIPEVQSFIRVLELPLMAEAEMHEAVQWAVRRHIPFDLEHVYIGWELLAESGSDGRHQVLVGAAQRDVVDPLLAVFDQLDLNVVALELESQAVVRCLLPRAPSEVSDIRGVLVVDLGATSTNVVFFDQGAMRYTASIQSGGDALTQRLAQELQLTLPQAVEQKALVGLRGESGSDARVAAVLRSSILELGQKVAQIVHGMSVQLTGGGQVRVVLLSGGSANLAGAVELFGSIFPGIPVQLGNPLVNLQRGNAAHAPKLSLHDALHFTTALGLAQRPAGFIS